MSDDIEMAVQVHLLNLDQYLHERIYAIVDQIADPNNSLGDMDEAHCRPLAVFFRNEIYNYAHGMMMVYFSSPTKPRGTTHGNAVKTVDVMTLQEKGYCTEMLDGCYWHRFIEMLQDKDGVSRAVEPWYIRYPFLLDGRAVSPAQAIILNKIANISER